MFLGLYEKQKTCGTYEIGGGNVSGDSQYFYQVFKILDM
jgi:hypothetical protein